MAPLLANPRRQRAGTAAPRARLAAGLMAAALGISAQAAFAAPRASEATGEMGPPSPTADSQPASAAAAARASAAPAAGGAAGQGGNANAAGTAPTDAPIGDLFLRDEPPATAYDRLAEPGRPGFAPESWALMQQLGRTVVALCFTIALIYLFFRLGLPRVTRLWLRQPPAGYVVRERLQIDSKNSLVKVEGEGGEAYLLGVGDNGVCLIDKLPAPNAGPYSGGSQATSSFSEALRPEPNRSAT